MKVKEIIVVEGKKDTALIQNAVDADTLETNGSEVSESTLQRIELAYRTRGVIVFTDPDYPGERIRKLVSQRVPGCKHAFLRRQDAKSENERKIGVEHATPDAIRDALRHVVCERADHGETISWEMILDAGLVGGTDAKASREKLGEKLHIGYMNAKQLYKRLNMFQITKETFQKAMLQIWQEDER